MAVFRRGLVVVGVAAAAACLAVAAVLPATAQAREVTCRDVSVAVPVAPVAGRELFMHGVFCPAFGRSKHAVQVLVPGDTYNHTYWDFPYRPDTYDFRLANNRAGFAMLTLDRLGTGSSSRWTQTSDTTAMTPATSPPCRAPAPSSSMPPGTAEPGVTETDERTEGVFAATEVADEIGTISTPLSRSIDVPVMLANGAREKIVCGLGTTALARRRSRASAAPGPQGHGMPDHQD